MSLNNVNLFNFLLTQNGNYNVMEDQTDYSGLPVPLVREDIAVVAVTQIDEEVTYNLFTRDEWPLSYLNVSNSDYHIWTFALQRFNPAETVDIDVLRWYDYAVWKSLQNTNNTTPLEGSYWTQVTSDSIEDFQSVDSEVELESDFYYRPVDSTSLGQFALTKTGDHIYSIIYNGIVYEMESWKLYDYKNVLIGEWEPNDSTRQIQVVTPEDGVYYVQIELTDGTTQYVEIYDFTDAEACFFNLVKNVLCECVDCNDCPDASYKRMLTFLNLYVLIRDIVYADRAVNYGLLSNDTLRTDWLTSLGMLIDKLAIMTSECICPE